MFDSWPQDSTSGSPQYERNIVITMATYWVPDLSSFSRFWPPLAFYIDICLWCIICSIQQAYNYVRSSWSPCLMLFKPKITKILKSNWRALEIDGCNGNRNFYSPRSVACSLPNFNGFCCKLAEIALFNTWYNTGLNVWHHQPSHLHILNKFSNLNISRTNTHICKW